MRERHPRNVSGPFYAERDLCLICRAPEHEAPDLIGFEEGDSGSRHCYFKKQPMNSEAIERAINALRVQCCGALRYGGTDPQIIDRLRGAGVDSDCIDLFDPQA